MMTRSGSQIRSRMPGLLEVGVALEHGLERLEDLPHGLMELRLRRIALA